MPSSQPIYNLEMTMRGCKVLATLNNLPLVDSNAGAGASFGSPLNSKLVGNDNRLRIVALPALLESGQISQVPQVVLYGTVKIYGPDDISAPENGVVIKTFDFREVIVERRRKLALEKKAPLTDSSLNAMPVIFPLELEVEFDNVGPAFAERFMQGAIIQDEQRLLDYAERLRDLMKQKAYDDLYTEFQPKFEDYNLAYYRGNLDRKPVFIQYLKEKFFPSGPLLDFERDDIILKRWCDGRVWQLLIKPDLSFFKTAGMDGMIYELEIFVGMVNGALKVIR